MKIYTMVLALIAAAPAVAASGYGYNTSSSDGYYTTGSAKTGTYKTTTTARKSGGYKNTIQNNFYSSQPARASSYDVAPRQSSSRTTYSSNYDTRNYNTRNYDDAYVTRERQVTTRTYSTQERKYFLAHPFFQPLKGRFGSVTDFAYATNNFKFDLLNGTVYGLNPDHDPIVGIIDPVISVKAETTQFLVKEDFSFGITDTLAVILMAQYDSTKIQFKDWSDGTPAEKYSKSGLNLFGVGIQDRFVDNNDWIAMAALYYQHQRDTANTFLGELKAGYKVDRTTVYGLARGGYSRLTKGDIYGAYVESDGDYLMLSYATDTKDILYVEGGLGVFSVLGKDFTFNGELIYGHYDWHEQLNIKGAIGWQPGDSFALNLYGLVSLYDSGDGKTLKYMNYDVNPEGYPINPDTSLPYYTDSTALYQIGDYKMKGYNEWKVGAQIIFYF